MKTKNKLIISTITMAILSIIFTSLIIFVDKQNIGAGNTSVGFAGLNKFFQNLFEYNNTFYKLTEILGYLVLCIALSYMIILLVQLIKRKSLKKVDVELLLVAIFYVAIVIIYILFEISKINFRPVLLDGELEASYPSSHTMIAVFICTTAILINQKLINNKAIKITLDCTIGILGTMVVIGRIISGVHWITDIIGAILISTTLVLLYTTLLYIFKNKINRTWYHDI